MPRRPKLPKLPKIRLNKQVSTLFSLVYAILLAPYLILQYWILKATNTTFDYEPFLFIQAGILFALMIYGIIMFLGLRIGFKIAKDTFPEIFRLLDEEQ